MPINPFINLFGSTSPTVGGAGAGAAAAGGGFPTMLIPILFSLLQSSGLFGGGDEDNEVERIREEGRQRRLLAQMRPQGSYYQSPYLPQIDRTTAMALLNQLKRSANWGWPEGQGMDLSWLEDILGQVCETPISPTGQRGLIKR